MPFGKTKQLQTDMAQLSQEMYKRNLELAETNQALSLLRTIDKLVLESHDELEVLCQSIAEAVIQHSNFPLVAIMANPPHRDYIQLFGVASSFKDLPPIDDYKIEIDDHNSWLVNPDRSIVLDLDKIEDSVIAETLGDATRDIAKLRNAAPIKSVALVKLFSRHRIVGLMAIGMIQEAIAITEKENALLDRLSDAVGIALDNKILFDENQQVLRQLQKSNEKLKAMDETKDEFISMASHQLRTPLTSVKGYLSMVLEGDSGEISEMQKKLLDQAYTSSQRMVYLIADLLNVSRLRTGKFLIEPTECDLAEVVDGEVKQLLETAKARGITINYDKPTDFPKLMLDETKIRQVMMNFMDNAIYYGKQGGHIDVKLTNNDKSIEFTVTDDGIGVPKSEHHHMFTKFYRAGNAKKARPDGTGLGLFMAKKVIIAQHGTVIFRSEEGKGSTFGFAFDKSKLELPSKSD